MTHSLRGRLLVGTSLAGITVLGLLGGSVYLAMRHALMSDFDTSLRTESRLVAGMLEQDGPKITFEFDPQQMPDYLSENRQRYFEVWREDGSVLARSPSLGDRDIGQLPDPSRRRTVTLSYIPGQQDQEENQTHIATHSVSIEVAAEPVEVRRTLALLGLLLTTLCGGAVVVMGAVLMRVVGQGMKPIKTLAGEIESLRETDLSHRLAAGTAPDELIPVVDKLNGLLTRLQEAFTREKSFTADVAHELRTPLAGLRSTLEVCRSRPRDPAAYEAALDECRGITDRMEAMVQSLLLLARSDAGQVAIDRRPFDLSRLVSQNWAPFQYRADRRGLKVSIENCSPCTVASDSDKLQIVLQNVFDNAVSYVDNAGQIRISVHADGGGATIEIANTGSDISDDESPRLFERFWRGDAARTDAGLHCGLGLSLSKRIMTLLGGEISIKTSKGGEFVVTLTVR